MKKNDQQVHILNQKEGEYTTVEYSPLLHTFVVTEHYERREEWKAKEKTK